MFCPLCLGGGPVASQWRLRTPSNSYFWAYEIEMRGTPGGADQCSGGTPTSSGNFNYTPTEAFDNNASTYHIAYTGDVWIAYQFTQPVAVAQISLTSLHDASWAIPTLVLEYHNGTTWVVARTWTGLSWATSPETKVLTV